MLVSLNAVPKVALAPLFVIWLGYLTTNHNDYKLLKNSIL